MRRPVSWCETLVNVEKYQSHRLKFLILHGQLERVEQRTVVEGGPLNTREEVT